MKLGRSFEVDREKTLTHLVVDSRALGEALLRKRLDQAHLRSLNYELNLFAKDGLTEMVSGLRRDQKTLTAEQRELDRIISVLRKRIDTAKRELIV